MSIHLEHGNKFANYHALKKARDEVAKVINSFINEGVGEVPLKGLAEFLQFTTSVSQWATYYGFSPQYGVNFDANDPKVRLLMSRLAEEGRTASDLILAEMIKRSS